MTAPNREVFKNNASTTLNGAINNSVTSITATSGAVFPSTGNFRILIDAEIMIVTARSTNTLTVVRGAEGTTAASHSDLAAMTHIVTAEGLLRALADSVAFGGVAAQHPLNKLVAADGKTLLTTSDFSWTNQGTASVADYNGTIAMRIPGTSNTQHRILTVSSPSAPWTFIAALKIFSTGGGGGTNNQLGLYLRESSTGKFYGFSMNRQSGATMRFAVDKWSSATAFSSTPFINSNPIFFSDVLWFKIVDNNTNLIFSISTDGVEWVQVLSEARTTFLAGGPNQIGFGGNNGDDSSSPDAIVRLLHHHTE